MSKPNSGGLWRVEEPKSDKHPNMTGSINIDGKEYWLSGWATRNPEGKRPHISLQVKPKDAKPESSPPPAADPDLNDDIPF